MKRFGIIGAGMMAQQRVAQLVDVPGAELVAISSRTLARAESLADKYCIKQVVGHYMELADFDLDAVVIATPTNLHYEMTRWALEYNLDVLVEGPLCTCVSEGKELEHLARMRKRIVEVGYNAMYYPIYERAREIIKSGEIGNPVVAQITRIESAAADSWYYSQEISGGMLVTFLAYGLSRMRFLLGNPISVMAETDRERRPKPPQRVLEEACAMVFAFPNGLLCSYLSTCLSPPDFPGCPGIKVVSTEGGLDMDWSERRMDIYRKECVETIESPEDKATSRARQVRAFLEHITERSEGRNPIRDAIVDIKIAEAIMESTRTGRRILLQ